MWLRKEECELLGYDNHPYDALLDKYEPNLTTKDVDLIFSDVKNVSKSGLICVDMGGTSFDVSIVLGGQAQIELDSNIDPGKGPPELFTNMWIIFLLDI